MTRFAAPTETAVRHELSKLGQTADAIARRLYRQGIKGRKGTNIGCPLGVFINKMFDTRYGLNVIQGKKHPWSRAVTAFISRFDRGLYPELEKTRK